jgi:hypothetical protein
MNLTRILGAVSGCLFLTLLFSLVRVSGQTAGTNHWTKPTSGYWEEPFWSLAVLPDATQSVVFNNPGWKALAIGTNAAQNFPDSMSVQSLRVESPVDSSNTLLMNWSGFERPLQTTSLFVGSNSAVIVHGSRLEVINTNDSGGNLNVGGTFIHTDFSQVKVDGTLLVRSDRQFVTDLVAPAAYYLTNGTLSVNMRESIGGFAPGILVQYNGENNVGSLEISTEGELELYGGQVTATNGITVGFGDFADAASFFQYGGSVNADMVVNGHNYFLQGGTVRGRMSVPTTTEFHREDGSVLQNGGTNFAVSLDLGLIPNRFGGRGFYALLNGVLHVDSSLTFHGGEFSQYNGLHTVSNLVMQGTDVGVGIIDADYVLDDGTLSAGSIALNRDSSLTVGNGVLKAGALTMNFEATGNAALVNLHGGSVAVSNVINIGLGNIIMTGGSLQSTGITVFKGEWFQSGGTNETGDIRLPRHRLDQGQGSYYLSGGTLLSRTLWVGDSTPLGSPSSNGVFRQTGGIHTNSAGIVTWGYTFSTGHRVMGTYQLSAGLLVTPSIRTLEGGAFEQNGGTNRAGRIDVTDVGSFVLNGGSIYTSNTVVGPGDGRYYYFAFLQSRYTQTDGSHATDQFSVEPGGVAGLQGGSLTAPSISVGPEAIFGLSGAAVTNSGTFTLLSGTWVNANGNYPQLGKLIVNAAPTVPNVPPHSFLNFGNNATTLRFRDSRDTSWNSQLVVTNWSGSVSGGGTDQFFVGTSSQGLTASQLALIRFANPDGFPPANYSARILVTGEVVPEPRPVISLTRSSTNMVVSWGGDYQLYTSTNVIGPYMPISGAMSPYTISFSEPYQFFILRSP